MNLIKKKNKRIKELEDQVKWLQQQLDIADEIHYDEMVSVKAELAITKQELKNKRLN